MISSYLNMLTLRYQWDLRVEIINRQPSPLVKLLNTANNKPVAESNKPISVFSTLNSCSIWHCCNSFLETRALHLWFLCGTLSSSDSRPSFVCLLLSNHKMFDIFRVIASALISSYLHSLSLGHLTLSQFCPCKHFKSDLKLTNPKCVSPAATSFKT